MIKLLLLLLFIIEIVAGHDCTHSKQTGTIINKSKGPNLKITQQKPLTLIQWQKIQSPQINNTSINKASTIIKVIDAPFMAGIFENDKRQCSGAIIDERFIATTALCCTSIDVNKVHVRVGSTDDRHGIKIPAHTNIYISSFDKKARIDDLCLIKLKYLIEWSSKVDVAPLPTVPLAESTPVFLFGWGQSYDSHQLKQVQLYSIRKIHCQQHHKERKIAEHMLCVGDKHAYKGACGVDYGAPLIANGGYLYGLASWNLNCNLSTIRKPIVFTDIFELKELILDIINKYKYP